MYDGDLIPGVAYNANIDGVTIPILQVNADNCSIMGTSTSCAVPNTPPNTYAWPDTGTPSFGTWTGTSCGGTLRGSSTACTVNLNFKSVTNGGPNSWAPQYIFTQAWANYAAQQVPNRWQPSHTYPIGFTITCTGATGCPGTIYYYQMTSSPANGLCQSNSAAPTWPAPGLSASDGSCTWHNQGTNAPLQNVAVSGDYTGTIPNWVQSTGYSQGAVVIPNTMTWNGEFYQEATTGSCTSGIPTPNWSGASPISDGSCSWNKAQTAVLNSGANTLSTVASAMPLVWETPFAYSQNLFYQSALQHYINGGSGTVGAGANQIRYIRTGIGVGEEASIAAAQAFESAYPSVGTLTDTQLKGIWINRAIDVYSNNATTMSGISPLPNWTMMALVNCGTGLSTGFGVDCTWADAEAQAVLGYEPYYAGYGTQGLQTSDLAQQQNIAQCRTPFAGKSCCSDNWCETRYYMAGNVSYVELQELCVSYPASSSTPPATCIYDSNNPNASLSEVLTLATQHGTNVIELGVPEFACAAGATCTTGPGSPASATAMAIETAATGVPSSTTAISGIAQLLGVASVF
jgi:hypothetical protein